MQTDLTFLQTVQISSAKFLHSVTTIVLITPPVKNRPKYFTLGPFSLLTLQCIDTDYVHDQVLKEVTTWRIVSFEQYLLDA